EAIGAVAREHGLWFHVDGSWGASIILSEKQRYRFRGLEKANSFSWNPHKMMNIPLICSVVLINDTGVLYRQLSTKDTDYIFHDNENAACDLGPASLQCGKRVDSLKLWLAWKYHGDQGYAQRIDHLFDLAQYATAKVEAHPSLELLAPTQTLNVNFRYVTESGDDLNTFNETLRELLLREGKSMVNYCRLNGKVSIRLILVNPDVTMADMDRFFDNFLEAAARLEAEAKVPAEGA
ncbi:MAG: pyridoxal-dependent decarboxylase, partial [Bacteroidota bacterium]